jgi:hypothetical protein
MAQHPHKAIIDAWTADTSIEIQRLNDSKEWVTSNIETLWQHPCYQFRIKPKMRSITVDGVKYEWPEPMRVAPKYGAPYWHVGSFLAVMGSCWADFKSDEAILKAGFMQATKEGAEAHRRALIAVSGGAFE